MSDAELDRFLEKRSAAVPEDRPGQARAAELEAMWKASEKRFAEKRRRELDAQMYEWFDLQVVRYARLLREARANRARYPEPAPIYEEEVA